MFLDAGGDGEDVGVEDDVLGRKADHLGQQLVGPRTDPGLARLGVGLALLVEGHNDHRRAVATREARPGQELRLAFLQRDGVEDGLALHAFEAGLEDGPLRRVEHDRHPGDVRLAGDQVEEAHHGRLAIEHGLVHVDVDDLGAVLHLVAADIQRRLVLAFQDQALEPGRAGDVGALADVDEKRIGANVEGLQAGQAQGGRDGRHGARHAIGHRFGEGADVFRRGAATAADDVDQPALRPFAQGLGQLRRRLVITAEGIRQAGVGVGRDQTIGLAGDLLDVAAQLPGTQGAIEAERERPGVAQGIPEGLGSLAGKRATRGVGDRARDHDRATFARVVEIPLDREQRHLGVQRIEYRLDQDQVGAALDEAVGGLVIRGDQLVPAHVAITRIVDVRRQRQGTRGRPQHAGDEARPLRCAELVGHLAGEFRAGVVQLVHQRLHAVIGQGDGVGVEGVGFENVGTGGEILAVNLAYHLRPRQQQEIVVALEIARPVGKAFAAIIRLGQRVALDHGAHGAVEDEDALLRQGLQFGGAVGHDKSRGWRAADCSIRAVRPCRGGGGRD